MLFRTAGREQDESCSQRQAPCHWRRKMLKGQCNNPVHHFLNLQLPQLPVFVSAAAFAATCWAVACVSASAWDQIAIDSNSWLWLQNVSSWRGIVGIGMGHIQNQQIDTGSIQVDEHQQLQSIKLHSHDIFAHHARWSGKRWTMLAKVQRWAPRAFLYHTSYTSIVYTNSDGVGQIP